MVEPQTLKANLIAAVPFSALIFNLVAKASILILTIMGALHKTRTGLRIVANKRGRFRPPQAEASG